MKASEPALNLLLGTETLQLVSTIIILGVILSSDLSWAGRSHYIRGKTANQLYAPRHYGRALDINAKLECVNAFIISHVTYCLPVWSNAPASIFNDF